MIVESGSSRPALAEAVLRRQLITSSRLWTGLSVVAETDSTNADLVEAARGGAGEGLVRVAEHQRAGRGRVGRSWASPPRAGLTVSVLLRPGDRTDQWPPAPAGRWGWLPLLAGVALVEAVTTRSGVSAHLKWPNDLLVASAAIPSGSGNASAGAPAAAGNRRNWGKCAGILAEVVEGAVVVGVGLNVTTRADELPPLTPDALPPTSLALAGATGLDRAELLSALLARIEHWYGRWRAAVADPDQAGLRSAYQRACGTLGQPVRVRLPGNGELIGTADIVDRDGRLVVATTAGPRALAAGDVRHLRPAPPPG